ncbi:MAG: NAD(P)-dependent oxidoreductase [Bryobacteraceae bacterium]
MDSASAHGIAVSDHRMGLLLAAVRRIPSMDRHIRGGDWIAPPPLPAFRRFRNLTVGLIGLGRIGSVVARRLRGFEMRILATDPYLNGPVEVVPLQHLLRVQGARAHWQATVANPVEALVRRYWPPFPANPGIPLRAPLQPWAAFSALFSEVSQ